MKKTTRVFEQFQSSQQTPKYQPHIHNPPTSAIPSFRNKNTMPTIPSHHHHPHSHNNCHDHSPKLQPSKQNKNSNTNPAKTAFLKNKTIPNPPSQPNNPKTNPNPNPNKTPSTNTNTNTTSITNPYTNTNTNTNKNSNNNSNTNTNRSINKYQKINTDRESVQLRRELASMGSTGSTGSTGTCRAFNRSSSQRSSVDFGWRVSSKGNGEALGDMSKIKTESVRDQQEDSNIICRNFQSKTITRNPSLSPISTPTLTPTPSSYLPPTILPISPQLYSAYRTQHLLFESTHQTFSIRLYSKGRKQIKYSDGTIQVYYAGGVNQVKLVCWVNGDWRLTDGEKVSWWGEQLGEFDQYFVG